MAIKFKTYHPKSKQDTQRYIINDRIRFPKLRVIKNNGENLGIIPTSDALKIAQNEELDLVIVSEKADPPVARIIDFSKYQYNENKKQAATKSKVKKSEVKELTFGPTIGESDLLNKIERAREFLADGNKVKITIQFKGREVAHPEFGMLKVKRFEQELSEEAKIEEEPKLQGKVISAVFVKK